MANYLITGSSRGIGLTLATQLAALPPSSVGVIFAIACTLTPSLQTLINCSSGRAIFVELEATDESFINDAIKHVENVLDTNGVNRGIDVLINNAGIMPITPGSVQEMSGLDEVLRTNVTSVQMVTRAFLPLLRKGREKKVANMLNGHGTKIPAFNTGIQDLQGGIEHVDRAIRYSLRKGEFHFVPLSPDWLQTDMGSAGADLLVEVGAKAVLEKVFSATQVDNGKFCQHSSGGVGGEAWVEPV